MEKEIKLDYHEVLVPNETPYKSFQEHINRYVFASSFIKDKVVLDVACGTGYGSSYLIRKGAKMVIGGDLSEDCLEYAKRHYIKKGLIFLKLDAIELPFPRKYFDVVVSFETIEHLTNYKKFLSECKRVLKKGGLFICSTPNKQIFSPHSNVSIPVHTHEFYISEFYNLVKEYFINVSLHGQRFLKLTDRIKNDFFYYGSKLLFSIPKGEEIKRLIKKIIFHNSKDQTIAKLGIEITDEIIDDRYKVLPYKKSFFIIPGCIIAIGKK